MITGCALRKMKRLDERLKDHSIAATLPSKHLYTHTHWGRAMSIMERPVIQKIDREMSCLTNSIMREVKPWRCLQYNVLYFLLYVRAREHDL